MAEFLKSLSNLFGTIILIFSGFLILILWRGTDETKFLCNGFILDQYSTHKISTNASFIFKKFEKFVVWKDQIGTVHFELHEPTAFHIFNVYKFTDHRFSLTEIGDEQKFLGSWSMISGKMTAKLVPRQHLCPRFTVVI